MNKDVIKIADVPKLVYELTGLIRSRSAIYQWIKAGRLSYSDERIKLKTVKRLGFLYTTREWIEEFIRGL